MKKAKDDGVVILMVGSEKPSGKNSFNKSPKGLFGRGHADDDEYEDVSDDAADGISSESKEKRMTADDLIQEAAKVGVNGVRGWPETRRVALLAALAEHCGTMGEEMEG